MPASTPNPDNSNVSGNYQLSLGAESPLACSFQLKITAVASAGWAGPVFEFVQGTGWGLGS